MRTSVIVTALGPDGHGLLAKVATTVADCNANIDDVSQTVANGMFTMIMFVSFDETETTMAQLKAALEATGERSGLQIAVQHENIFKFMHRI
jgi:ACT domain-containing protein